MLHIYVILTKSKKHDNSNNSYISYIRGQSVLMYHGFLYSLTKVTSDQIHQRPRASSVSGGAQRRGANPSQGKQLLEFKLCPC